MTIDFALARENMVEQQVRPWDVLDVRVLDTLTRLPREVYVAEALRGLAYADTALPIGHGETMMKPVLEELHQRKGDRLRIIKIDIDQSPAAATAFHVQSVPTLLLYHKGKQLWRQSGVLQAISLEKIIDQHITSH